MRLLSLDYAVLAECNTYSGLGRYPTSAWRPGEVVQDDVPLMVEAPLPPGRYLLAVVLLAADGASPLPILDWRGGPRPTDIVGEIAIPPPDS